MSSPLSSLKKEKKMPFGGIRSRNAPYKALPLTEEQLISQVNSNSMSTEIFDKKVSDNSLMSSMMGRLTTAERNLAQAEAQIKEKDKKIKILEEKCNIYKNAQGYGETNILQLEKKCQKLQKQIHSMEMFLEDYGMIWVGSCNSDSDFDQFETEEDDIENEPLWIPNTSIDKEKPFLMDFDLVIKNLNELSVIAGEGEHFIKHTKDGARLQVKEPIPLTLYSNGIFMFGGPFRSYTEETTQQLIKDVMDGYFPSELQLRYPEGVPFKVNDQRGNVYRDKRLEKLFPGEGLILSPEKEDTGNNNNHSDINNSRPNSVVKTLFDQENHQSLETFLLKLPSSVIKKGRIIDVREDIESKLKGTKKETETIVIETDVVKEMKSRLSRSQSRPPTPCNYSTLRVKSETGDQTFILKMRYSDTINDIRNYLDVYRRDGKKDYEIKSSFPSRTFTDLSKTLKECQLIPNATLHMTSKKLCTS